MFWQVYDIPVGTKEQPAVPAGGKETKMEVRRRQANATYLGAPYGRPANMGVDRFYLTGAR